MDIIHWKPDRAYDCFKQALRSVGQDHVADIIEEKEVLLQTELDKRESKMLSACTKTTAMCGDKSDHGFEIDFTSILQKLPCPVEVSTPNKTRVLTIVEQDQSITSRQKTSRSELPALQQLAICEDLEFKPIKDGILVVREEREERRRLKRTGSKEANRQRTDEGGFTVGVKLSVDEVHTDNDQPGSKELLREIANYIWRVLSFVVRKPKRDNASEGISHQDQTGIYEFLRSFESKHCKVKHVGVEPVLFVVQCMNLESLETITTLDKEETFANLLENAVLEGTLAQQHRIIDVTLVTHISEQEINLCKRVLGNLETSLKVFVQTTPERSSQIEYELCQRVETRELTGGSEISTAARGRIIKVEHSSILLTLQFQSLDDLKTFREDLDSGKLARRFEDVLITDDIKEKYDFDNLGLSVTLVDPWEYEMCEIELSLIDERKGDLAENNLDETIQLEVETVEQGCCHQFRLEAERLTEEVRRLKELKKNLLKKVEKLEQKETKKELDCCHHFRQEAERLSEEVRQLKEEFNVSGEVEKHEQKVTKKANLSLLQRITRRLGFSSSELPRSVDETHDPITKAEQESGCRSTVSIEDDEETFDVFIAHSSCDYELSVEILSKPEKEYGLKCCHSSRDFCPGVSIQDNVVNFMSQSRKVLFLLSIASINSGWVMFEMQITLCKENETRKRVMIPVLLDIGPEVLKPNVKRNNYLMWNEVDFWPKLIKAIEETVPLSFAFPVGDVALGLVWGYFYGYLNLVLPDLAQQVAKSEWATKEDSKKSPILSKLLIILPKSCYCPESLITLDKEHFSYAGHISYKATRVGNINRDYKSSVYKVRCPDKGKEYFFLAEFATPLLSLYEMERGPISYLDERQKHCQRHLFTDKLREILEHPNNSRCHKKAILMPYDDGPNFFGKDTHLARQLVRQIQYGLGC